MDVSSATTDRVRQFVLEKFPLARKRSVKDSDELLESGIVDSLGILDLVALLETEFGLTVSDDDLLPENFRSIERISEFAQQRRPATK
jgi:acyl carrier protein